VGPDKETDANLKDLLLSLTAEDLKFLCGMFRLRLGGSKGDLVERLISSDYTAGEIADPANEIAFGVLVEGFVPKNAWADILVDHGLASSGSRHTLLLLLIENRLMYPKGTLEALNPSQLREVYFDVFGRVPTTAPASIVGELLDAFGFVGASNQAGTSPEQNSKAKSDFDYDIALSFAGEDRSIARQLAARLHSKGVRAFMDEYERTELWGKDLSDEFRSRFGEKTRYVLVLASSHYAVKDWTDFEFTVAKKEAGRRRREFILPVRLDDTPLPGLRSAIAYLSLKELGVDGIVEEIIRKLRLQE